MNVQDIIKHRIESNIPCEDIQIKNVSHRHQGHRGSPGTGDSHFELIVISKSFKGLTRIQRQQQIYALLQDLIPHPIHALSMKLEDNAPVSA